MTEKEVDALEAAAKAATPGPFTIPEGYKIYAVEKHFASAFERYSYNKDEVIDSEQAKANAAFIAAADPSLILNLIAELRQAKEECLHHEDYIAELEQSSRVYDKKLADISKLLDIEHEDGSYAELSYIYHSVKRLQVELRQARRERDWLAEVLARDGVETKKDWLRAARQLTMEEE